ncbi:acyl-CoA dehydrogenase, partial [Escherichia coli]|nr:acyl-CoA dehydrogenase [Escherichia coli]
MSYYPLNSIPDYYMLDNLLTEEHKLVRNSVRQWVQSSVVPQIDNAAQTHKEIPNLIKIGALGAY